jgi:hypothetical protein
VLAPVGGEALVGDSIYLVPALDAVTATAKSVGRFAAPVQNVVRLAQSESHGLQLGLKLE